MNKASLKRGFLLTGNAMVAGVFFLLVGVFGFNFFSDDQAPTVLSIESRGNEFALSDPIILDIYVITRIPFNALDVTIHFPNDEVEVVTAYFEETVIDVWVQKPSFSNNDGTVTLTGGTTRKGGVVGKSPIASVVLKPLKAGTVGIDVTHSLVLASDGEGSDLNKDIVDSAFVIRELQNPDQTNVVRKTERKEYVIIDDSKFDTDLNNDGQTTLTDLSVFMSALRSEYSASKDVNLDGVLNIKDLSIIMTKILTQ
jgi:hypothetical protein